MIFTPLVVTASAVLPLESKGLKSLLQSKKEQR